MRNDGPESVPNCSEEAVPERPEPTGVTDEPVLLHLPEAVNTTDELVRLQFIRTSQKLKHAGSA